MKFYRYWASAELPATNAKGHPLRLRKWGKSNTSLQEAEQMARKAVEELKRRIDGKSFEDSDSYAYSMRDIAEEVVSELGPKTGITRNAYGCLVLNTTEAFFADIDIKAPGAIARLFGNSRAKVEMEHIARLKEWLQPRPSYGARIYRTAAGLRYLFTHAPLGVTGETSGWLKELGADPLYTRLCGQQKCFRARLTPKPWRAECEKAPRIYPRNAEQENDFRKKSQSFASCKFVETAGSSSVHGDLAKLVKEHDRATRADENLPLA